MKLTINEVERRIEEIDNDLTFKKDKRAMLLLKVKPKATDMTEIKVATHIVEDKFLNYVIEVEKLENEIKELNDEKKLLQTWLERQYFILEKFEPYHKKIIDLRKNTRMTWEQIAREVGYSVSQAQRIYSKYTYKDDRQ